MRKRRKPKRIPEVELAAVAEEAAAEAPVAEAALELQRLQRHSRLAVETVQDQTAALKVRSRKAALLPQKRVQALILEAILHPRKKTVRRAAAHIAERALTVVRTAKRTPGAVRLREKAPMTVHRKKEAPILDPVRDLRIPNRMVLLNLNRTKK